MTIDPTAATARLDVEGARVEALRRELQARLEALPTARTNVGTDTARPDRRRTSAGPAPSS